MPSSSRIGDRRQATVIGAVVEGWRRALAAPVVVVGVMGMTAALALPLAVLVGREVEQQLGSSATADRLVHGWDVEWAGEFSDRATALGHTLTHEIVGFGATLDTLSRIVDRNPPDVSLFLPIGIYLMLWLWLSGGILDRLARGRPVGTAAFFGASAVFFVRFVRLWCWLGPLYLGLYFGLQPLLFEHLYGWAIRDMTNEARAMVLRGSLYAIFLLALMMVSLLADFAKVRMVVEDRRSALAALAAAARFIRRRFWRVSWLYALNILVHLVLARIWLQTTPGGSQAVWVALLASQVYLVFRVWARLGFMASEIAFFQGELAHAQYAALPEVAWPDSPSVEALRRLSRR
jgi:hypothetical protein